MEIEREENGTKKKLLVVIILEIIALLILGAVFILLNINKANRYQDRLSMGNKYLAEMNYEDAQICYRNAIRIDQKKAEAYVRLSDVYVEQNRYDVAWDILELAQERVSTKERRDTVKTQMTVVEDAQEEYENGEDDSAAVEEKEQELSESDTTQEEADNLYTIGYRFVARNGWAYSTDQTGLYICENNVIDPDKNITGNRIDYKLMAVDNGVYFGYNHNSLAFYNRETNEQTVIYTGSQYVQPLGMTEKYLYFTEMPSEDADEQDIIQMNREDGSTRRFSLENFCIHSNEAFCGERFFYTRGVADVSTSGLYEVDPETGNVTELEANTGSQILAKGDTLYYVRADERGDFSQIQGQMTAWNTATDEKEVLLSGIGSQVNSVLKVTDQAVYYRGYNSLGRISQGNVSTVASGDWVDYLGEEENGLYYRSDYDIYFYDENSGESKKVWTISENVQIVGIAYGRINYMTDTGYFWEELEG